MVLQDPFLLKDSFVSIGLPTGNRVDPSGKQYEKGIDVTLGDNSWHMGLQHAMNKSFQHDVVER